MGRAIVCDHCGGAKSDLEAEGTYLHLKQGDENEFWFCSIVCLSNWAAEHPEVTGEDIDDDSDNTDV